MAAEQAISTWIRRHHGRCQRCGALVKDIDSNHHTLYWTSDGWLCKLCEWRRARAKGDSAGAIE